MQRDVNAYLWDIADAAASIRSFIARKTFEDYLSDELLRSAVERKFTILGEALSQLLQFAPEFRARISLPERVIAFRNRLVHGYMSVEDEVVWQIIQKYLPQLQAEVENLLNSKTN